MNCLPADLLNIQLSHYWVFRRHARFFITFGWSYNLDSGPKWEATKGTLTAYDNAIMRILCPGGIPLIFGVGFDFPLLIYHLTHIAAKRPMKC